MPTESIPDLCEIVLRALDLHSSYEIPRLELPKTRRRLVVASGNALPTGQIIFADERAVFADEGAYTAALERETDVDSAVVISASGEKHAPIIVGDLTARGLPTYLITCSPKSTAASSLPADRVVATRSIPEPITYNTSTYMGMILAKTREDPAAIKQFLLARVLPLVNDLNKYEAYYLMLTPQFDLLRPMFVTKFDELFGGRFAGRCYTTEQTLHAKTVVPWDKELFISFGTRNEDFGSARLDVPLPENPGFVAAIATGYYVIGYIQAQKPAWFKEHAAEYAAIQKTLFAKHMAAGSAQPGR